MITPTTTMIIPMITAVGMITSGGDDGGDGCLDNGLLN